MLKIQPESIQIMTKNEAVIAAMNYILAKERGIKDSIHLDGELESITVKIYKNKDNNGYYANATGKLSVYIGGFSY